VCPKKISTVWVRYVSLLAISSAILGLGVYRGGVFTNPRG